MLNRYDIEHTPIPYHAPERYHDTPSRKTSANDFLTVLRILISVIIFIVPFAGMAYVLPYLAVKKILSLENAGFLSVGLVYAAAIIALIKTMRNIK